MIIYSQNVASIAGNGKIESLGHKINAKGFQFDLVCLQETALKQKHLEKASRILGYGPGKDNVFHDTADDTSNKGVTIILSRNHIFKNIKIVRSLSGTFIIFNAKYKSKDFIYGGFYGHSGNCDAVSYTHLTLPTKRIV